MVAACLMFCGCSAQDLGVSALSSPPPVTEEVSGVAPSSAAPVLTSPSSEYQETSDTPDLVGGSEQEHRVVHDTQPAKPPSSSKVPVTNLFYSGSRSQKEVALTFDDGPDVQTTTKILDVLQKYNVKATFFIIGTHALAHPEMVRKIAAAGHAIGNHSWDHPDFAKLTPAQVQSEVTRTNDELDVILGYRPAFFRPPYGSTTPAVLQELQSMHYNVVDWSVDTMDWAGTSTAQILVNVRKEMYPGGIILEHCAGGKDDNLSNTVAALPQIISSLRAQGYTFVTVPDLLHIPANMS